MKLFGWFQPAVIDPRPPRFVMAEAVRQLASGTITNIEFEDRIDTMSSSDGAIDAIARLTWFYYDDIRTHKLQGKYEPTKEGRQLLARCVLFLRSDFEYSLAGPVMIPIAYSIWVSISRSLRTRTSLVKNWKTTRAKIHQTHRAIDKGYFPFQNPDDYNEALKHPVYLAGAA